MTRSIGWRADFTIAFGLPEADERKYARHVAKVAEAMEPVEFVCEDAMLGADEARERAFASLVPDKGFGALSRLHNAVYTQAMAPWLSLDDPYVPHITLGSSTDRLKMKRLRDEINAGSIANSHMHF